MLSVNVTWTGSRFKFKIRSKKTKNHFDVNSISSFFLFDDVQTFFEKWANPVLFFVYFLSFQTNNTIFTTNQCEKCPNVHLVYGAGIRTFFEGQNLIRYTAVYNLLSFLLHLSLTYRPIKTFQYRLRYTKYSHWHIPSILRKSRFPPKKSFIRSTTDESDRVNDRICFFSGKRTWSWNERASWSAPSPRSSSCCAWAWWPSPCISLRNWTSWQQVSPWPGID